RGPVVDEHAVAEALAAGRLWGYGADVFAEEPPPPDHPLIGRPDVMLTPHSAAQTEEGLRNMATMVAQEVVSVLQGTPTVPGQRSVSGGACPTAARTRSALSRQPMTSARPAAYGFGSTSATAIRPATWPSMMSSTESATPRTVGGGYAPPVGLEWLSS